MSIRAYYTEKTRIEQAEIDAEIRRTQAALSEQLRVARNAGTSHRIRARVSNNSSTPTVPVDPMTGRTEWGLVRDERGGSWACTAWPRARR